VAHDLRWSDGLADGWLAWSNGLHWSPGYWPDLGQYSCVRYIIIA